MVFRNAIRSFAGRDRTARRRSYSPVAITLRGDEVDVARLMLRRPQRDRNAVAGEVIEELELARRGGGERRA